MLGRFCRKFPQLCCNPMHGCITHDTLLPVYMQLSFESSRNLILTSGEYSLWLTYSSYLLLSQTPITPGICLRWRETDPDLTRHMHATT